MKARAVERHRAATVGIAFGHRAMAIVGAAQLDLSIDRDGLFCISEDGVSGLSPRITLMDQRGHVVARWDSLSAHGSWVDAHGDIYLALGARERVDKYVLRN